MQLVEFARRLRAENEELHPACHTQTEINNRAIAISRLAAAKTRECIQRCKGKTPVQYKRIIEEMEVWQALRAQMCRTKTYRELVEAICDVYHP